MNKYEKLIEHIINDENDKARALFHEIVVEKSRDIYESLMDHEMSETMGGNQVNGMMDEIQADESGLPEDEEMDMGSDDEMLGGDDMGMDDMGDDMGGEQDLESKVMDLEAELESLKAEFEQLMGDEAGEEEHNDGEDDPDFGGSDDEEDMGDDESFAMEAKEEDDEEEEESLEESKDEDEEEDEEEEMTESKYNYRKSEIDLMREYVEKVTAPSNSSEGHEVGKGGSVSVNKTSITDNMKNDMGGTTANIVKGGAESDPKGTPPNKTGGVLKQGGEIDVAKRNVNKPGGNKGAQNWYNTKASAKSAEGSTTDGSVSVAKDSILKRIN
jgi:hypothetical protein